MQSTTYVNHMNFAVPPDDLEALDACIEAVLPWRRYVKRDDIIGYRIGDGEDSGGVFIRPVEACGEIAAVMKRVRRSVPDLDRALVSLGTQPRRFRGPLRVPGVERRRVGAPAHGLRGGGEHPSRNGASPSSTCTAPATPTR